MPPSSKRGDDMSKEINADLELAFGLHIKVFVNSITKSLKDFVRPLDPSGCDEEMEYTRSVIEATDNLILTALMLKDDEEAKAQCKESSERMIQELIELHNPENTIH